MAKIVVLLVALLFRLLYLGIVPSSLAHDEIDNIIQAHSFIHTGTDIVGTWHPQSLLPNSGVMAEWGPLINAAAASLLPATPFAARLTTALLSSLFPLLIWILMEKWGASRRVALITSLLLAISPWHILFSRTALEQPTSLFFYVLSWIFLTNLFQVNKHTSPLRVISYSLMFSLSYLTAFLTYHGYKFSLPFLTLAVAGWLAYQNKINWKLLFIPLTVISLLFIHVFIHRSYYSSRSGELIITVDQTTNVDFERRQSVAPQWEKKVFTNKLVLLGSSLADKYLGIFSPDILFLHGEANGVFSTWKTGYVSLYVIPLLLLGLFRFWQQKRSEQGLIILLLLMSPLTSVVQNNNSYSFRSAAFFVLLLVIAAYGADYLIELVKGKIIFQRVLLIVVLLSVISCLSYFCYIYYFLTPVANANAYFFGDRLLANYVRVAGDKKILIIDPQPRYTYSNIVLARGRVTADDITSFQHHYSPSDLDAYHVGNLTVVRSCSQEENGGYDTIIVNMTLYPSLAKCSALLDIQARTARVHPVSLVSPKDSGEERRIYGDQVCTPYELSTYVHPVALQDFSLENMSAESLCTKWMTRQ